MPNEKAPVHCAWRRLSPRRTSSGSCRPSSISVCRGSGGFSGRRRGSVRSGSGTSRIDTRDGDQGEGHDVRRRQGKAQSLSGFLARAVDIAVRAGYGYETAIRMSPRQLTAIARMQRSDMHLSLWTAAAGARMAWADNRHQQERALRQLYPGDPLGR